MIKKNFNLLKFNTFKIDCSCDFFSSVSNIEELVDAINFSRKNKIKFAVVGNGSNILFSKKQYGGLVIKNNIKGYRIEKIKNNNIFISAGAGENFDDLIKFSIKNKAYGLENLWYIPGTVGASAVQNIGAYGVEAKDFIEKVEAINTKTLKKIILKNKDCKFKYRDSIFKRNKNLIITKVYFKLNKKFIPNFNYSSLSKFKKDNIKPNDFIRIIEDIRKSRIPSLDKFGSAGSFFKNPIIKVDKYNNIFKKYPDLPFYLIKNNYAKLPLAFVLDKICKLNNFKINNVGLYEKQPLVIVNYGGANFSDINNFAKKIENKVFLKTKIKIEREVENIF